MTAPHSQQDPRLTLAPLAAVSVSSVPTGEGHIFVVFQLLSCVQLFAAPRTAAHQASLSIAMSQSLLKLISIRSVMPFNHLILCLPLLLLPSIFPSIRVFSNESALHIRWYWSFSFSISPSHEYSGLIPFRMDWLDLLAVQGTLKSLLQHYSSKASILWHSAFFMVQISQLYTTTGKTIALTIPTFVGTALTRAKAQGAGERQLGAPAVGCEHSSAPQAAVCSTEE